MWFLTRCARFFAAWSVLSWTLRRLTASEEYAALAGAACDFWILKYFFFSESFLSLDGP